MISPLQGILHAKGDQIVIATLPNRHIGGDNYVPGSRDLGDRVLRVGERRELRKPPPPIWLMLRPGEGRYFAAGAVNAVLQGKKLEAVLFGRVVRRCAIIQ